jgi:hypothetical protein
MINFIRKSFIGKHWRGEYSLPVSYWLISLLTNITIGVMVAFIVSHLETQKEFNPYILAFGNLLILLILLLVTLWHFIGTWRSASFYSLNPKNEKSYWGGIAKLIIIFGVINSISNFIPFSNTVVALMEIAFSNDASLPDYKLTITEQGTELKIEGGLKYGIVKQVENILIAAPSIKNVNLESLGGRIGIGEDLFELISRYNLNTVTNDLCASACTIAFAGGKERWLGFGAKLGFHAGKFETLTEDEMRDQKLDINNKISKKNGTSKSFLIKGDMVPNNDMWYPTIEELLNEKYLTSITSQAASSLRIIEENLSKTAKELKKDLPNKLNDEVTLTDIQISGYKFIYIYDISSELQKRVLDPIYRENLTNEIKLNVCKNESLINSIKSGVVFGYDYYNRYSKIQTHYFEINNCDL